MALNPDDPRHVITRESFGVAPELLGAPLARPGRRLVAMALDGVLVGIVAQTGATILGVLAAASLWKASRSRPESTGFVRAGARTFMRLGAALLAFVLVANVAGSCFGGDGGDDGDEEEPTVAEVEAPPLPPGVQAELEDLGADAGVALDFGVRDLAVIGPMAALLQAGDSAAAADAAADVARWYRRRDFPADEAAAVRTGLLEMVAERPAGRRALAAALPAPEGAVADAPEDTGAAPPAEEVPADPATAARLEALQEDVTDLRDENDDLRRDNERLEEALDEAEGSSLVSGFRRFVDEDLGIGFGWGALYFTAFLALWNGRTPGKRALGIRVIRLDGRQMSWWIAFERFGGYAASLSIGLLGFAQILWDRNRQGLHDKAVETVVVRDIPRAKWKEHTGGFSPFEEGARRTPS